LPYRSRVIASVISGGGVIALIPLTQTLWSQAEDAAEYREPVAPIVAPMPPSDQPLRAPR